MALIFIAVSDLLCNECVIFLVSFLRQFEIVNDQSSVKKVDFF